MLEHQSKIAVCKWWIERGFSIVPCQPNNKYLVAGYGEYKAKFESLDAVQLFGFNNNWNVAVLGGKEKIILDFDEPNLYDEWTDRNAQIATTYTERTPRGGAHVFIRGAVPGGLILKPGVEIKKICLVYPSVVGGIAYTRGAGEILEGDPKEIFSSLSKIGTRTVYALEADQRRSQRKTGGLIEQIKLHWPIEKVFLTYRPSAELRGAGRYKQTHCPFHDDKKPSFYLDTEKQLFGCHGCGAHGDVINLYARLQGIENREAVKRMALSLGVRS